MGITKQSLLEAEALENICLDDEAGEMIDPDELDWLREELSQSWTLEDQDSISSRQPN